MDCLFCRITEGTLPAKIAFEDERLLAFHDLHPQAPVHLLVIPRKHVESLAHLNDDEEQELLGSLLSATHQIARAEKLDRGYRVVINTGSDGGQTVSHLHLHLLGGRSMQWPPG